MGDRGRDLHVLDLLSGALRSASLSTGTITPYEAALSWCERDDRIAASSGTENAWIWLAGAGGLQRAELLHSAQEQIRWGEVNGLAWNRGCHLLAVGTSQGLYIWNADTRAASLGGMRSLATCSHVHGRVWSHCYELVVAKGGSKLKATDPSNKSQNLDGEHGQLLGKGVPIPALARNLSRQLGRTVIDKTGLSGRYYFKLT
jgi:hypothetical protein